MKLGILVNTERHGNHLVGLTKAALGKGHEVTIFFTDTGTRLLQNAAVTQLALLQGVKMSYCANSVKKIGLAFDGLTPEIIAGSQMNNAFMNHLADKVIVL